MSIKRSPEVRESLKSARHYAIATSNVLLSLLTALIATILSFMANTAFGVPTSYSFIPFIFVATLEMLYSKEIEKRILQDYGRADLFRIAEIFILAILLRVLLLFTGSPTSQIGTLLQNFNEPVKSVFTTEFNLTLIALLLIWVFVLLNQNDMALIYNLREYSNWEEIGKEQANLIQARQRFIQRFLFIGMGLLVAMIFSVSQWDNGSLFSIQYHGVPTFLIITMLAYFVLVLLLMSQTQLARLRTRWWINESVIQPAFSKNWLRISLVFFAVVAGFVLLLPTGFGEQLLQILQTILLYLMAFAQSLVALIMLPIALLLPGLKPSENNPAPTPEAVLPEAPPESPRTIALPAWLDTAGDILFWVVLGLVFAFAMFQYLRQDRSILSDLRTLIQNAAGWLVRLWESLTRQVNEWQQEIQARRKQSGRQSYQKIDSAADRKEVHPLDEPRRRIFQLYQQFLTLGTRLGKPRKPAQTPLQYQSDLQSELGESPQDLLETITATFDQARYSQEPIDETLVESTENQVERFSQKIHENQRNPQSSSQD